MFWVGVYLAGTAVALALFKERFPLRLLLAACWPLGPISFVVTVLLMLAALPFARPVVGTLLWLVLIGVAAVAYVAMG
jgi:hypothetical protein